MAGECRFESCYGNIQATSKRNSDSSSKSGQYLYVAKLFTTMEAGIHGVGICPCRSEF